MKGQLIDELEYEPLLDERPSHSGAGDESIGNNLVEDTESSARPADDELKTDRSDRQPGKDTETTGISADRRVPSITEDGQTQEEALGRSQRLLEDDFRTRMIGGGPDTGPVTISGTIGNNLVEDTESSARPADDELKTDRSDRQPGKDTETTGISADRRVPSITEDGQTQEEALGRSQRLLEDDFRTRMIGGGPDTGPVTISGRQGGEAFSVSTPLLHQPPLPSEVPDWSDGEAMPLIIIEKSSVPPTPTKTRSELLIHPDDVLRVSPTMNSSGDPGGLSAPLSPNRVRKGHSQDMPAEGSLFAVSPDTPGYSMRPAGAVVQSAVVSEPPPPNYVGFNNPFFGTPIAFAQCQNTAGMDTTTTLPVYNIPRDCSVGVDQSSVPTIYASGVTPDSIPWSTAEDIIRDIAREGPFDPDTTPMDTEDSPLINASMPGCPFRMTSYTGPAMVDSDTSYGLQLHHPRFLEFIGAPESARLLNQSPSFWVDRLGQASAMAAAMNLQRDAGFMMTNLQILEQFVMSLHVQNVGRNAEHRRGSCSVSGR